MLRDILWRDGKLQIRKTGVRLRIERALIAEIGQWMIYLMILVAMSVVARLRRSKKTAIWYGPDSPRAWYLMRGAALWAGFALARNPARADALFCLDDSTRSNNTPPSAAPAYNFNCRDISKSRVAEVFERSFGYPLALDPRATRGLVVEKSEANGVHDGVVVMAPCAPKPGRVYQRLIDTVDIEGACHDLRTPCVGGAPVVVWEKLKPAEARFGIHNRRAVLRDPAGVFSPDELSAIARFNAAMGLDWGGLDILRSNTDGRIYIVDANKTDLGPVIALSWQDKIASMRLLSRALEQLLSPAERDRHDEILQRARLALP